jgi:hypothetical protein
MRKNIIDVLSTYGVISGVRIYKWPDLRAGPSNEEDSLIISDNDICQAIEETIPHALAMNAIQFTRNTWNGRTISLRVPIDQEACERAKEHGR